MCLKGNIPAKSPYIVRHMTPLSSNFDVSSGRSKPTRWSTAMWFFFNPSVYEDVGCAFAMLATLKPTHYRTCVRAQNYLQYAVLSPGSWRQKIGTMIDKNDSIRMSWRSSALVGPQFWKSCCRTHLRHALVFAVRCILRFFVMPKSSWSCPTCAIPANVPRSGSVGQPASSGFCVTRGL